MTTGDRIIGAALGAVQELRDSPVPVDRFVLGEGPLLVSVRGAQPAAGVTHRPPGVPPDPERVQTLDGLDVAAWTANPSSADADPAVARAVGMAALSALSAPFVDWQRGDSMAALAVEVDTIATVGLFQPAFRKWHGVKVRVVERKPVGDVDTPVHVSVSTFPPGEAEAAFDGADILFVTGSALVYGGLGDSLAAARGVPTIVLIGATASFLPEPAFAAGVTMLAGARVTDVGAVADGIKAGLCGTDFHDRGLEKVYVAASEPTGLDLPAADSNAGD